MGHDISGYNKSGEEICYIRFGKLNPTATVFYNLFDARDFHAGVSGTGASETYTLAHVEKTLANYKEFYGNDFVELKDDDFLIRERKEILKFINNCFETAKKEGSVKVFFG
ncbi:hypothetical protein B4102_3800 [Heyndrickxia sporothermodurans]|uniref:Uncharacterized protein n=1 Tax=Heyndrickxia sporothermodurans TaxID=46224 RepID=A0A150KKP9_9BACI|nr:hypothetical protein [Heyndrickxia sporothermodurans]KYC91542.1 hypothetical protein B4102_3800 [Heyndrickxia sporothermodurans]